MIDFAIQLALAVVPTIFAITLHEAAHGYAAMALGDNTARDAGRLSLNPLRHVDRVGTIILPGILLITQLLLPPHKVQFMFGWAKPVPVSPWMFRNPRQGMALVAAAGPGMNFMLAWLAALAWFGFQAPGLVNGMALQFLFYFILSNLVLGLFNLLPIPPLDGGRIAVGVLPLGMAMAWARLERAGIFIVLFVVFLLPFATGLNPVGAALDDILPWAFRTVFWLAGHDVGGHVRGL
jgi:Zn-dependent protease